LAGDIGTLVAVTHHTGANGGTLYTHHSHRGDIVLVRTGTSTTDTYGYSAFGNLESQIGPDVCRFKFSSKEREATCGFSYYGYRFYAPQWQRWVSRDPVEASQPDNSDSHGADWMDATARGKLYCFAVNDPINTADHLGLNPIILAACGVCGTCLIGVSVDCAILCSGGKWDTPGEGFGCCWLKCMGAFYNTRGVTTVCSSACILCGVRGGQPAPPRRPPLPSRIPPRQLPPARYPGE
jgi:RHS repeat-associated protein